MAPAAAQRPAGPPPARRRFVRNGMARLGALIVRVGFLVGRLRPLRAHVVLASQRATRLDGNLLYLRREMERRVPPVPVTVLAYRTGPGLGGLVRGAWQSLRAGYHLATARVFVVDNWYFPMDVITPRPGTVRVQTWHAAGAFKKVGYSVLDKSFGTDEAMIRIVPIHAHYDVCLTSSSLTTAHYTEAFRLPRERFTSALGLPRTDVFFDAGYRARATEAVRRRYALPAARKVLLYAPTFRGDTVRDARHDDSLDLRTMRDALEGEWLMLLRLHPWVRASVQVPPELAAFVVDASDWPDVNELMFVSDLLVTDYSSVIFEFALLDRPMAFFASDLAVYEGERGFYFDYATGVPGPVFERTEDLAAYVAAGTFDLARVRSFARTWFDMADGHASERVVDRIVLPALRGERVAIEIEPQPGDHVVAPPAPAPARSPAGPPAPGATRPTGPGGRCA